ncbi:hypothetical protein NFI96_009353 [Prochilodus magdalenae]|nr:hypothetical protein NFI96_009353 [Prochilodus magdalenae]
MGKRGASRTDEEFSFVSPVVKYLLFFFNMLFWMISLVLMSIGVYARLIKHETAMACLTVDPSILLTVVGVLMFLITFCGCVGSLRENICLLQTVSFSMRQSSLVIAVRGFFEDHSVSLVLTEGFEFCICLTVIFLLQLTAGILGFVFSDKVRHKVTEMINNAIEHYRDDLDLQNLIDYGQKEVGEHILACSF